MSGVQLDPARMAAIAEQLRRQIPNASAEAARPMIDAAGELQRLADQVIALQTEQAKTLKEIASRVVQTCSCPDCTAKRATASNAAPGSLN